MASFQEILNKPAASVEPPSPLPVGTYLCIVDGQGEYKKMGKNNTDVLELSLKPIQPQPDVDQEALATALKDKSLQDKPIRHRLFITDDAVWRLRKFIEDCGIEVGTRSLGELVMELPGKQVLVTMGHRASDDGTQIFGEVKNTAKV